MLYKNIINALHEVFGQALSEISNPKPSRRRSVHGQSEIRNQKSKMTKTGITQH